MVGLKWPPDTSAVTRMPSCKNYAKIKAKKHLDHVYVAKQKAFTFATLPLDPVQPPKRLEDVILNRHREQPEQSSRTRSLCWWRQTRLSQSTPPQIPWWIEVIEWIYAVHIMHIMHIVHIENIWASDEWLKDHLAPHRCKFLFIVKSDGNVQVSQ